LEVLDQNDQLVPDAVVPVSFSISGVGELAAAGTANPKDVESFRQTRLRTYHGRALAIVRPTGIAGSVTLRVQASGFASASAIVQVT
jgi:beta-galactosidase